MAAIRAANTKPELLIRRSLHALGFRYRLNDRRLPGRPDLVFPRRAAVLFVNGCFWHGHECALFRWPATRPDFWRDKIEGNVRRDVRAEDALIASGWRVGIVWECALKGRGHPPLHAVIDSLTAFLEGSEVFVSVAAGAGVQFDSGTPAADAGRGCGSVLREAARAER